MPLLFDDGDGVDVITDGVDSIMWTSSRVIAMWFCVVFRMVLMVMVMVVLFALKFESQIHLRDENVEFHFSARVLETQFWVSIVGHHFGVFAHQIP